MKKKKKVLAYSRESIIVAVIFLLLAAVLWIQKSGERYTVSTNNNTYLKGNVPTSKAVFESLAKENLVLYDENNDTSRRAKEQFAQILKDMKQGYQLVNVAKESLPSFSNYKKVIQLTAVLNQPGQSRFHQIPRFMRGQTIRLILLLFGRKNMAKESLL